MNDQLVDFSDGIYQLAERCEVGIGAACRRAGIAASTPVRWKSGTRPRPVHMRKLRRVIIEMAREAGTLPLGMTEDQVSPADIDVRAGLRSIVQTAQAIEATLDRSA